MRVRTGSWILDWWGGGDWERNPALDASGCIDRSHSYHAF